MSTMTESDPEKVAKKQARTKRHHDKIKAERDARKWNPPEEEAAPRQRRQPSRSYTAEDDGLVDIERRTVCQCERPNLVVEPHEVGMAPGDRRRYCIKCGKKPRRGT